MPFYPEGYLLRLFFWLCEQYDTIHSFTRNLLPLQRFSTLCRSIGLGILTFVRDREEPPKVVVTRSRKLALARSAIHLLPALVSIALITINVSGYFIGSELQGKQNQDSLKLGLLQVAAKTQELLIVSSLATVIFHVLRAELMFGDGVPLGLVVSGWSFTQLSYFWSAEFWGGVASINTSSRRVWRRYFFVSLVFISGILAIMAGPAAAVLMVPRIMDWSIGGGIFWMNGSDAQLWPTYLDASYYSDFNCSDEWADIMDPRCASAGFAPLSQHYTMSWTYSDAPVEFELQDRNLRKIMHVIPSTRSQLDTWAYTAHAVTATMQDSMRSMHAKSLAYLQEHPLPPSINVPNPNFLLYSDSKRYVVQTKAPAVRTICLDQDTVDFYSGNLILRFPILEEYQAAGTIPNLFHNLTNAYNFDTLDVSQDVKANLYRRRLVQNMESLDEGMFNRTRSILTIPLSIWNHTASSIGIVLLLNKTDSNLITYPHVITCSIDARWAKARSIIETTQRQQLEHEFAQTITINPVRTELDVVGFGAPNFAPFNPPRDGSMTVIRLDPSWFEVISPLVSEVPYIMRAYGHDGDKQTTLEKILESVESVDSLTLTNLQQLISTCIADALSRCGMIQNDLPARFLTAWNKGNWAVNDTNLARTMFRNGDPKESFEKPAILNGFNTTRLVMRAYFNGYALATRGAFDVFCIIILLLHALIAVVHTIWVVFNSPETSGAWDSILELVVLTLKSPAPTDPILSNTSAGVKSFRTVGSVAWVERQLIGNSVGQGYQRRERIVFKVQGDIKDRDPDLQLEVDKAYDAI
ncbi:hypothetical protein BGZ63DRAFT_417405 [Mariannaea sp. PMI_226]|nr:hypothetical protein BGZ63DRAFT_417405 [Mariannaea sp. PMI_226]